MNVHVVETLPCRIEHEEIVFAVFCKLVPDDSDGMTIVLHDNRHFTGDDNGPRVTEYLVNISFGLFGEVIDNPVC